MGQALRNDFVKGEMLMLSTGRYDDYGIYYVCRVLKDFNRGESLTAWASDTKREIVSGYMKRGVIKRDAKAVKFTYENKAVDYPKWIIEKGYVEEVDAFEYHLASDPCHDIYLEAENF